MKKLTLIILGCIVAATAVGQDSISLWSDMKLKLHQINQYVPVSNTNRLILVEIPAGKSVLLKSVEYDSTWQVTEYNNTSSAITYSAGWTLGQGLSKFINADAHWGTNMPTQRVATFTTTLDKPGRIELYSERFNESWGPHGVYQVTLDGGSAIPIDAAAPPIGSDKDRHKASWRSPVLSAGQHVVKVTTTKQMSLDGFKVLRLTLTPK